MDKKTTVLCIIPARGGSKRIPGKNTKLFAGKPLIGHTIEQAWKLSFIDRIIVDTDSPQIATVAKKYKAEVPFLRPKQFATDTANVADSTVHLLARLADEGYRPEYVLLLQTTSPLREIADVEACWRRMQKGDATTVLTVCPTHPQLFHLGAQGELLSGNKNIIASSNTQAWKKGYKLNGCFAYITQTKALLKEKKIVTQKTKAIICPAWRSVDLDTPEDWVLGEFLYRNRAKIEASLKKFK